MTNIHEAREVARRKNAELTQQTYNDVKAQIESQISYLKALLEEHQPDRINYAHIDDLQRLYYDLENTIEFMGGDKEAPAAGKFWTQTDNGYKAMTVPA